MKILYVFLCFDLFLLEGKQGLSVGEFDIMQICIAIQDKLVIVSCYFCYVYVLFVYVMLFLFISSLFYCLCNSYIFLALNGAWNMFWTCQDEEWRLWSQGNQAWICHESSTSDESSTFLAVMSRQAFTSRQPCNLFKESQLFSFEQFLYFRHNFVYRHPN